MKSKYLALLLTGIVCLSGLTACSNNKQTGESKNNTEADVETTTDKDYIETTLNLANNEKEIRYET
jgi:hypothetical protein